METRTDAIGDEANYDMHYRRRRALEEREAAARCSDERVRRIHSLMADLYEQLAEADQAELTH